MKFLEKMFKKDIRFVSLKYQWIDLEVYLRLFYFFLTIVFFFFLIIGYLYFKDITTALLLSFFLSFFLLLAFSYYPRSVRSHFIGRLEKDLPFMLMDLDIKLNIGMNFIASLESVSKEYGFLGGIFKKVLNNYEKGISFQKSFLELSQFFDSHDFKRALNQIFGVYQSGYKAKETGPLFSLAEELLEKQKSESKIYHSKLVMISLLFIGITAILPALVLIFVSVGGMVINVGVSPVELLLLFVVVFPIMDFIVIFIIYLIMPSFMR